MKLKSGELKPIKGSMNQIRHDETAFFKPLSDLGIEFEHKGASSAGVVKEENERYPERTEGSVHSKPNVFSKIKRVFVKPTYKPKMAGENNFKLLIPELSYSTDNATMIALAAGLRLLANKGKISHTFKAEGNLNLK